MTNEEAKVFLDNLKICIDEHPIVADWLVEIADHKTEPKTQTKTQNSNLTFKTLEYCDICDHKGCEECVANALDEHCMPSQFKKQIEDECAKEYEELGLKELKELIEADRKTENNSGKPNNCETWHGDCKTCEWYDGTGCGIPCCDYEPKDEPQKLDCRNKKYYSSCEYANKCHPTVCFKALDEFKEKLKDEPQTERSE